jgi:hypothetical protein
MCAIIASRLGHTSVMVVFDVDGQLNEGFDREAASAQHSPWEALRLTSMMGQ